MIDQVIFDRLLPRACAWARVQEALILARGVPLDQRYAADARRAGVKNSSQIRVLVVGKIPLPEDAELAEVARWTQIIPDTSRAITMGHGIIVRADCWSNRELIVHQLVHVAQCERCGGVDRYVEEYLSDRQTCVKFSLGAFEEEARRVAREICEPDAGMACKSGA